MIERNVRDALRKLGPRAEVLDRCPVCGGPVRKGHDRVQAWAGKWAHRECAAYVPRRQRRGGLSQPVHKGFTPA